MAIQDYKVSETYSGRDISSLPDKPNQAGMSATELKARFDQLSKEVIPQYNYLIDFISGALFGGVENTDHIHDTRYYTETELDAGQLDDRYYTETEVNDLLATNSTNDRSRANHTGTQLASTISDFDSEVSNNTDVSNNTSARHIHANKTILDNTTASFTSADETKLDGIQSGAEVNQNAISNILVGGTSVSANAKTDTFEFIGGSNIQIIVNPTTKQITFNATGDISVSAENTTIVDLGGYFESGNVEGALQEIGLALSNIGTGLLQASNNLSDVADVPTARDNLGLGSTDDVEFGSVKLNGGVLSYDADRQMLQYTNPDGTTNDVGAELWFSEGKASGAIANGDCVQFAGVEGDHYLFKTAVPSEINANPSLFMGIATSDIANNAWGKVTHFGVVHDINTNGWSAGTILWFDSVNGGLTATKPSYPNAQIQVCAVVVSSSTVGSIIVRPTVYQDAYTRSETDTLLNAKAPINNPTFTGNVSGITKAMVGLGNVDNTSDVNKPISTATQTALDGKLSLTGGTLTGALNGTSATLNGLLTTNGQIKFPATQNPSADANTLDDYEEGTFSPTLGGGTVLGNQTYSARLGKYTKIGNVVYAQIRVMISAKDASASGVITIGNLPFVSSANKGRAPLMLGLIYGITLKSGYTVQYTGFNYENSNSIVIYSLSDGSYDNILVANMASNAEVVCSIKYMVD